MTEAEFQAAEAALLAEIPEEFRGFIHRWCWNLAGLDNVLARVRDITEGIKEPIEKFEERIARETHGQYGPNWEAP